MIDRRRFLVFVLTCFAASLYLVPADAADAPAKGDIVKFARFKVDDRVVFGVVEGDNVREISGSIFGDWKKTDKVHAISDVTLLVPTHARQVFAMAGNYKSHVGGGEIPPKFQIPQPFYKSPSSLLRHGGRIVIPKNATEEVHFEAEMVIVIGQAGAERVERGRPRLRAGRHLRQRRE